MQIFTAFDSSDLGRYRLLEPGPNVLLRVQHLDGYSRYIVHWEIRAQMTEQEVKVFRLNSVLAGPSQRTTSQLGGGHFETRILAVWAPPRPKIPLPIN